MNQVALVGNVTDDPELLLNQPSTSEPASRRPQPTVLDPSVRCSVQ